MSASRWLEDTECTQHLATPEPSTLLVIVLGKSRGPTAEWRLATERQFETWPKGKKACQAQFREHLSLMQWKERVGAREQSKSENLVTYTLAELKLIAP